MSMHLEHRRPSLRPVLAALALAVTGGAMLASASAPRLGSNGCATSTLGSTIVRKADGTLACGPGEALTVRTDLAAAGDARATTRDALGAFVAMGDMNLTDEESPLRAEFADKCGDVPTKGSFRPHEALLPHLVNAHVRAAGELASTGSPVFRSPYGFAVTLGNGVDNAQANERDLFRRALTGGLAAPGSGAPAYEGVQARDPQTAAALPSLPDRVLTLANEPFMMRGLSLPVVPVAGNRDLRVQGVVPEGEQQRSIASRWATGSVKVSDLSPAEQQAICDDPTLLADPSRWTTLAAGTSRAVTPDPARTVESRGAMLDAFTALSPMFAAGRCADAAGEALASACASWTIGDLHFVVLDTSPPGLLHGGAVDREQLAWLERDLVAHSSTYFDADGDRQRDGGGDKLTIVFTHHGSDTMDPTGLGALLGEADLDALLLRFPNVVLRVSAHAGRNRILPHRNSAFETAYWEVVAPSLADWPSQFRSLEIADNHDGTLSIAAVLVDAAVPANPRSIDWAADTTRETAVGAPRSVNEDLLASAAREIAASDPQRDPAAAGSATDRNVELLLEHPWGVTKRRLPPTPQITPPPVTLPPFTGINPGAFTPPNFNAFPPGFTPPTGFPAPQFPAPQPQFPPTFYGNTQTVALPVDPGGDVTGRRAGLLLLVAGVGAMWLFRARVRRSMVGA